MAIPLNYNVRNLMVRKTTTFMTALGISLTVAVLLAVIALLNGLWTAFSISGDPLQILVMRKGSTAELSSNFSRAQYQDLKFKPGIAKSKAGEPMVSLEMVQIINLPSVDSPDGMNITIRGILPVGFEMRSGLRISEGRMFETGKREVVVGKSVAKRYPAARMGSQIEFGRGKWTVVGIMDAGQGAVNSEIFLDLNQGASDFNRSEVLSSALVRAADPVAHQALINDLTADQRLNVTAEGEKAYLERQTQSGIPIFAIGILVSSIMAVGSCFAAMNTMYAAVARRAREIGTLRVLGFSRFSILFSFFAESLMLSLLGGLLGILLVLPLNNITTGPTFPF
ncbi:MAG: ABC transporter permease [Acidobacteria bacterium]|nr:ABC transporter permease [Acidobacteriota bacterium]